MWVALSRTWGIGLTSDRRRDRVAVADVLERLRLGQDFVGRDRTILPPSLPPMLDPVPLVIRGRRVRDMAAVDDDFGAGASQRAACRS